MRVYASKAKGKNAYNNNQCNLSSIKIQLLTILKTSLLIELEKIKKNKDSQKGNFFLEGPVLGGKVGARQTNIFLSSA